MNCFALYTILLLSSATNALSDQPADSQAYAAQLPEHSSHLPGSLEGHFARDASSALNGPNGDTGTAVYPVVGAYGPGSQTGPNVHPDGKDHTRPSVGASGSTGRQAGTASHPDSAVSVGPNGSTEHPQLGSGFPFKEDAEHGTQVKPKQHSKAGGTLQARTSRCIIPRRCFAPVHCLTPVSCRALARYCWKKQYRCALYY